MIYSVCVYEGGRDGGSEEGKRASGDRRVGGGRVYLHVSVYVGEGKRNWEYGVCVQDKINKSTRNNTTHDKKNWEIQDEEQSSLQNEAQNSDQNTVIKTV